MNSESRKTLLTTDETIRSYGDLWVWTESMNLAEMCYRATKAFPGEEVYGMTSQIRRAAAAIPANIAEGYGRENSGEFVRFLRTGFAQRARNPPDTGVQGRVNSR